MLDFVYRFPGRTVLMAIQLSDEIKALLDAPNFAHLATLMPDAHRRVSPSGWVVKVIAY